MTRLYVAGPMTGLPEFNYPAFYEAEDALVSEGFEVENPARNDRPVTAAWSDFLRDGLTRLLVCGGVALLPGWEPSRGAQLEVYVARALGMGVAPIEEWLAAGPFAESAAGIVPAPPVPPAPPRPCPRRGEGFVCGLHRGHGGAHVAIEARA